MYMYMYIHVYARMRTIMHTCMQNECVLSYMYMYVVL